MLKKNSVATSRGVAILEVISKYEDDIKMDLYRCMRFTAIVAVKSHIVVLRMVKNAYADRKLLKFRRKTLSSYLGQQ
jgi:hypothetical protein